MDYLSTASTRPLSTAARAIFVEVNDDNSDGSRYEEKLRTLVKTLVMGERDALRELYTLTAPRLFSLARRVLSNKADAEEVLCDVYTQVWQTAAQYNLERSSVSGWLMMICRSRAIDRYRQNKSLSRSAGHDSTQDPDQQPGSFATDDSVNDFEQAMTIQTAMLRLTPLRRRVLALAFFQGLSHHEIAIATQLSLGTVKSHIRRSLAILRQGLENNLSRVA